MERDIKLRNQGEFVESGFVILNLCRGKKLKKIGMFRKISKKKGIS